MQAGTQGLESAGPGGAWVLPGLRPTVCKTPHHGSEGSTGGGPRQELDPSLALGQGGQPTAGFSCGVSRLWVRQPSLFRSPKHLLTPSGRRIFTPFIRARGKGWRGGWPLTAPSGLEAFVVASGYFMFLFHLFRASGKPVGCSISSSQPVALSTPCLGWRGKAAKRCRELR